MSMKSGEKVIKTNVTRTRPETAGPRIPPQQLQEVRHVAVRENSFGDIPVGARLHGAIGQ